MQKIKLHLFIFSVVALLAMLSSCRQTETTVISGDPQAASQGETKDTVAKVSSDFQHLVIGETHPIKSRDPLFASNTSTKRLIQLLYEGLVKYGPDGNLQPAIAKKWSVSTDSLTYRFSLRSTAYYHDSSIFDAGVGQRVTSHDFQYIFNRMGQLQVPPDAARLFFSIKGFEPYYREQHQLYNPSDRKLKGVSGIKTPSDTALVIQLAEKDPHLLHKLASPYAVVYPPEMIRASEGKLAEQPVGSGPFRFSEVKSDSIYILSQYEDYWKNKSPSHKDIQLDRIDIIQAGQQALFKKFAAAEIDLLPELGPLVTQQVVDERGTLSSSYQDHDYQLYDGGTLFYRLLYHSESRFDQPSIQKAIHDIDFSNLAGTLNSSTVKIDYKRTLSAPSSLSTPATAVRIPYSDDPYIRVLVKLMSKTMKKRGTPLQMSNIRVPVQSSGIVADQQLPLYPGHHARLDSLTLVRIGFDHYALGKTSIEGFNLNRYPWWFQLDKVTLIEKHQ